MLTSKVLSSEIPLIFEKEYSSKMNYLTQNDMPKMYLWTEHDWLYLLVILQTEENVELPGNNSNSSATNLPSTSIDRKKYMKFSETVEKILPEIRGWSPEHEKQQ